MSRDVMQQALEALELAQTDVHWELNSPTRKVLRKAEHALRTALAEQKCPCGDRPADQCPGEWEPGCDLGANEKHAKVAEQAQPTSEAGWLHRLDMEKSEAWMAGYAQGLKRAAEQAQPVAWGAVVESGGSLICASSTGHSGTPIPVGTLIYTTPPAPQPLTELPPLPEPNVRKGDDLPSDGGFWTDLYDADQMRDYARAVEAEVLRRMGVQR